VGDVPPFSGEEVLVGVAVRLANEGSGEEGEVGVEEGGRWHGLLEARGFDRRLGERREVEGSRKQRKEEGRMMGETRKNGCTCLL
jgi:hypothetical protein